MIALWLATGFLAGGGDQPSSQFSEGDGYSKRPIIQYRPKAETKLEEVLEAIEGAPIKERTSIKRKIAKDARRAIRDINAAPDFKPALVAIETALSGLSRVSGEYDAFQTAAMQIAVQIESLIADMQAKRKKRRREEEMVIQWLFS